MESQFSISGQNVQVSGLYALVDRHNAITSAEIALVKGDVFPRLSREFSGYVLIACSLLDRPQGPA